MVETSPLSRAFEKANCRDGAWGVPQAVGSKVPPDSPYVKKLDIGRHRKRLHHERSNSFQTVRDIFAWTMISQSVHPRLICEPVERHQNDKGKTKNHANEAFT